jgi:hypothetical protein
VFGKEVEVVGGVAAALGVPCEFAQRAAGALDEEDGVVDKVGLIGGGADIGLPAGADLILGAAAADDPFGVDGADNQVIGGDHPADAGWGFRV